MNKNILINAPVGTGSGIAIYNGYLHGFSHIEWSGVFASMAVCFAIVAVMFLVLGKKVADD